MRLATLPNMRVDASLNAIGGFMCVNSFYFTSSSTSLMMGDGCGSLKLAKNFGGCEAFASLEQPFLQYLCENTKIFHFMYNTVTCRLMTKHFVMD